MRNAGSMTRPSVKVPYSSSVMSHASKAPGTTAGVKPSSGIMGYPCSWNQSMVAFMGAGPWPFTATTFSSSAQ